MQSIDCLGWAVGLTVAPFGVKFGIRVNEPEHLAHLQEIVDELGWTPIDEEVVDILFSLRIGKAGTRGRRNYHLLYFSTARLGRELELGKILAFLKDCLADVTRSSARNVAFLPGSVVVFNRRLLVLPGGEGTGKSTLVKMLSERGGQVLTDSYFGVDAAGSISFQDFSRAPEAIPILICFTEYRPKNKTLRTRTISCGQSALYLFSLALNSRSQSAMALRALASLAQKALTLKGNRGEASQAADYLLERLERVKM